MKHWLSVRRLLLGAYQFVFARVIWQRLNRVLYLLSLHGLGVLNYQNSTVSGERRFLKWLLPRLRPRPVVLDVGAHTGEYSAIIKQLLPEARVFAFEPGPATFQRLEAEAQRRGFTAINKACGETPGRLPLYDRQDNFASAHASLVQEVFSSIHHVPAAAREVDVINLDSFAREAGLDQIDLLKIDVEGFEMPVLKGARALLAARQVSVIQIEFGEMQVVSRVFFRDFLQLLPDFRFFRLLRDGLLPLEPYDAKFCEIFAFQNIVALRQDTEACRAAVRAFGHTR